MTRTGGLSEEQFTRLFPFHLACDRALRIQRVGTGLARLCPGITVGAPFAEHFELLRPASPIEAAAIRRNEHVLHVLRHRRSTVILRAQVLASSAEQILFLATPWVRDVAELNGLGLTLNDFPLHDATPDLLQLMQATTNALDDTKALADQLAHQRARLRSANQALRTSEARYRMISERVSDLVTEVDAQNAFRFVYVSRSAQHILGHPPEDMIGHPIDDFIHPVDLPRLLQVRRERASNPVATTLELRWRSADGSYRLMESVLTPILNDQGAVMGVQGISRDIRRRKEMEEALRLSEEKFRTLSEQSPLGVLSLDLHGKVTFVNQRLIAALGGTQEDVLGDAWQRLFPAGAAMAALEQLKALPRGAEALNVELPLLRPDGSSGWVSITGTASYDRAGNPTGFLCVTEDISAWRAAEEAIKEAEIREMAVAAQVQEVLLHGHPPIAFPGLSIGEFIESRHGVNGDFYEFFVQNDTTVDVLLGDAMGKGLPAALQSAATKARFSRVIARLIYESGGTIPDPVSIVARVQRTIGPQFIAMETFTTLMYLRFELTTSTLTWVGCGHPGILFRSAGGSWQQLEGDNAPLGFSPSQVFSQDRIQFNPGDIFVVYSDGLTETTAPDGTAFGIDRLMATIDRRAVDAPTVISRTVQEEVERFAGPQGANDDVSCLVIRAEEPLLADATCLTEAFPASQASLPMVRSFCARFLWAVAPSRSAPAWSETLVLAIHEAFTNILRHSLGPTGSDRSITMTIGSTAAGIRVRLDYDGLPFQPAGPVQLPDLAGYPEHGFGLALMAAGCDRVEYGTTPEGRQAVTLTKDFPTSHVEVEKGRPETCP